ncbi:MAG: hypothetical protein KGL40_09020 [Rhodocyclaceae bacterium]|nr:hypothetical protein [Rhodocyclaceae bacterium]
MAILFGRPGGGVARPGHGQFLTQVAGFIWPNLSWPEKILEKLLAKLLRMIIIRLTQFQLR